MGSRTSVQTSTAMGSSHCGEARDCGELYPSHDLASCPVKRVRNFAESVYLLIIYPEVDLGRTEEGRRSLPLRGSGHSVRARVGRGGCRFYLWADGQEPGEPHWRLAWITSRVSQCAFPPGFCDGRGDGKYPEARHAQLCQPSQHISPREEGRRVGA